MRSSSDPTACICSSIRPRLQSTPAISTSCGPIRRSRCTATTCGTGLSDRRRDLQRAAQEPAQAKQRRDAGRVRSTPRRTSRQEQERQINGQTQLPETNEEFQGRLAAWYAKPEAFHREFIYLSEDRLAMLQDEVWEITQQYLDARRRGKCYSTHRAASPISDRVSTCLTANPASIQMLWTTSMRSLHRTRNSIQSILTHPFFERNNT